MAAPKPGADTVTTFSLVLPRVTQERAASIASRARRTPERIATSTESVLLDALQLGLATLERRDALDVAEVRAIVAECPTARFEALSDFAWAGVSIHAGKILHAHHFGARLLMWAEAGLRLGVAPAVAREPQRAAG